jgi:hypothetical protein
METARLLPEVIGDLTTFVNFATKQISTRESKFAGTFAPDAYSLLRSDLGLDEGHSLRTVLVDVLLVGVCIVSSAAVRVGRVAV